MNARRKRARGPRSAASAPLLEIDRPYASCWT